ncbi:hypothetical protein B0H13DRAFT_1556692, partial [Mycena leptocephala]
HYSEKPFLLSSLAATASDLRSRLIEIETQTERLRIEKERISECLASLIYPILTLPPEITSEIFLHCARATTRGPLGVAGVCKAWRSIALATPALWKEFWCTGMQNRNLHHLLQCWLPRAGGLPLTL